MVGTKKVLSVRIDREIYDKIKKLNINVAEHVNGYLAHLLKERKCVYCNNKIRSKK